MERTYGLEIVVDADDEAGLKRAETIVAGKLAEGYVFYRNNEAYTHWSKTSNKEQRVWMLFKKPIID
jgi:hypothetical protein